jgi:hypothetical protein
MKAKTSSEETLQLLRIRLDNLEYNYQEVQRHIDCIDDMLTSIKVELGQIDELIKDLHPKELGEK